MQDSDQVTTPSKTPAPPRRFLPSSTSSTTTPGVPPGIRRTPFQSSRKSQAAQSVPSFSATQRFQRPDTRLLDEIDSSLGDDDDEGITHKKYATSTATKLLDELDDDAGNVLDWSPLISRKFGRTERPVSITDEKLDSSSFRRKLTSTTHAAKRQKNVHVSSKKAEPITISSSPEESDGNESVDNPDGLALDHHWESSIEDLDEDPPYEHEATSARRFREPTHFEAIPRSGFRAVSRNEQGTQGDLPIALPDFFSPSKGSRRHEYLPGGNAETVRNWGLNITAQQSQPSKRDDVVVVDQVQRDVSNRLLIVHDTAGSDWLLPTHDHASRDLGADLARIKPGTRIVIRGQAMTWPIRIETSNAATLTVAALWGMDA